MLKRFASKQVKRFFLNKAEFTLSRRSNCLYGRDILQPMDLDGDEWKKILWYAFDLKKATSDRSGLSILPNKHITLLFVQPCVRYLLSCSLACQLLGAKSTIYNNPDFEKVPNFIDIGRALSQLTDLLLINNCNQEILCQLAEGSSSPVVGLSSNIFSIVGPLACLMTMQEKYGYLKRLKVAWIGPSNPVCNAILSIYPLFGINLQLCCICPSGSGLMSPIMLESALKSCNKGVSELHQFSSPAEAIHRAHVIFTTSHSEERFQITVQMVEEAEFEWIFLHTLPRSSIEVTDDIFQHKNNLTWTSISNQIYIAMALIMTTLGDYQPSISMPQFEGVP